MVKALVATVLVLGACIACSSDGSPETACASPPPGQSVDDCRDFGEGEGPLGG